MKKAKRYDGEDGSLVEGENTNIGDDVRSRAMASVEPGMKEAEPEENFKPRAKPAAVSKSVSAPKQDVETPKAQPNQYGATNKSIGSTLRFKDTPGTHPEYPEDLKPAAKATASAPKKEMYRDMSGKMREKAADTSAADAAARREKIGSAIKGAASSIGDYFSNFGKKEKKSGTYRDFSGKVQTYAKGGSVSASSRGDGIAQRGKTKGRII